MSKTKEEVELRRIQFVLESEHVIDYTPDEWAKLIDHWADIKGWNEGTRSEAEWAALAHTEISEAFEAYRNDLPLILVDASTGKPEGIAVEYADALIRIFHWFAQHKIDPNVVLQLKMQYNATRPHRHGGKKA